MNPLNLSPVARAFWASLIRHTLSGIAGVLVAHGYVTETGANAYVEELVGVGLYAGATAWSNRAAYWQRVKLLVALMMPKGSTEAQVLAHIASGAPLPSSQTPPSTAPGVPDLGAIDPARFIDTAPR